MPGKKYLHSVFLGGFDIKLDIDRLGYHEAILSMIPHLFNRSEQDGGKRGRRIALEITGGPAKNGAASLKLDQCDRYDIASCGLYRFIDYKKNSARVFMTKKKYSHYGYIYHSGFLAPLSLILRKFNKTLIHAALIEKAGKGLLIAGERGSGKSSLSIVYLLKGYRCFSDEHPLLSYSGAKIRGYALGNMIGLPPRAARNFPELSGVMRWSPRKGKYFIDPGYFHGKSIRAPCQINTIAFPEYSRNESFLVKKLKTREIIRRLVKDEYFHLYRKNLTGRRLGLWHLELLMRLAQTTDAYQVRYGPKDLRKLPGIIYPH